jgi:AAA+ ATPase superfamily predicted ATPase
MKFYNREKEIELLRRIKGNFRVAVIGRRRVGKTTLVEHFYKKRLLTFFFPAEKAEKEIIYDWVSEYENLNLPKLDNFKDFFEFIFSHFQDYVTFLDEIQNVLKVKKSFIYDLQRLIDKYKPNLVVSGSLISLMKKLVENYKSPLYGRFDFIIKLKELDFETIFEICDDFRINTETSFKLYSVFGGIPKYYELVEKIKKFDFENFTTNSFVYYPRPLFEEVKTMLKEEFGREYKTFFSILSAISRGKNKHSEIAEFIGKKQTEITKYLSLLKEDFEFIARELPVAGGKKGFYIIKNNIINFWFSNIWKYTEFIETLQEDKVIEIVKNNLNNYTGSRFERIVIELILSGKIGLPFKFEKVGRQWGKFKGEKGKNTYEIDIVALNENTNENTKEIVFCECKWQNKVNARKVLEELKEKAEYVDWNKDKRKEHYCVFAKSFKEKIKEKNLKLFDLRDLERVFK